MLAAQPPVGYSLRWSPQCELGFWRTVSAGTSEQPGFVTIAGTQDRLLHASPEASVSTGGQVSGSRSHLKAQAHLFFYKISIFSAGN